jgi:predicted NUDIX family NTP pyrophosphohydrolase
MKNLISAGLLMYKRHAGIVKVFLVHPGGPFFVNKDEGYWSIPKGLVEGNEDLLKAAIREFEEETGINPKGDFIALNSVKQKSGKTVYAWAFEYFGNEEIKIVSNHFEVKWPPNSGKKQSFPEVDQGKLFTIAEAKQKMNSAQVEFLIRLEEKLKSKEHLK